MGRKASEGKGCLTLIGALLALAVCYYLTVFVLDHWYTILVVLAGLCLFALLICLGKKAFERKKARAELKAIAESYPLAPSNFEGWYTDPLNPADLRFWSGDEWTSQKKPAFKVFRHAKELSFPGVYVYSYPIYEKATKPDGTALHKIGMTTTTIFERVTGQTRSTEVPEDAVIKRAYPTADPRGLEKALHSHFASVQQKSKRGGTEWFWVKLEHVDEAAQKFNPQVGYMDAKSYIAYRKGSLRSTRGKHKAK